MLSPQNMYITSSQVYRVEFFWTNSVAVSVCCFYQGLSFRSRSTYRSHYGNVKKDHSYNLYRRGTAAKLLLKEELPLHYLSAFRCRQIDGVMRWWHGWIIRICFTPPAHDENIRVIVHWPIFSSFFKRKALLSDWIYCSPDCAWQQIKWWFFSEPCGMFADYSWAEVRPALG